MIENQKIRPAQVIGPLGEPLTIHVEPEPASPAKPFVEPLGTRHG